jgi:tetratricopeptide (TPR) repeat protein
MNVLLDLLEDATDLLDNLEDVEDLRASTRRRLHGLLRKLITQSSDLVDALEEHDSTPESSASVDPREARMQRGLAALARDRLDDAREVFQEAVEEDPDDIESLNHLALTCWEADDIEAAADWYGRAMEAGLRRYEHDAGGGQRRPSHDYIQAIEGRALALYRLGRLDEAASLFEVIIGLPAGKSEGCRYLVGEIRHLQGRPAEAIEWYRTATAEPSVWYNHALALWELERPVDAAEMLIRAFRANRHIGGRLAGEPAPPETQSAAGYVGSAGYADEYMEACRELWNSVEAGELIDDCWNDTRVQRYLSERSGSEYGPERTGPSEEAEDVADDGRATPRSLAVTIVGSES